MTSVSNKVNPPPVLQNSEGVFFEVNPEVVLYVIFMDAFFCFFLMWLCPRDEMLSGRKSDALEFQQAQC